MVRFPFLLGLILLLGGCASEPAPAPPPNVLLVLTDDQGYGDLACSRQPDHPDARTSTACTPRVRPPDRLPRRPDLLAHPLGPDDRPLLERDRRLAHDHGPVDPAEPDEVTHGRRVPPGRLSHRHLRQVAPGRQLPLPAPGPRLRRSLHPRRRRGRPDARLLGQRLLRRHLLPQRPARTDRTATAPTSGSTHAIGFIDRPSRRRQPFFCYLPTNAAHGPYRGLRRPTSRCTTGTPGRAERRPSTA